MKTDWKMLVTIFIYGQVFFYYGLLTGEHHDGQGLILVGSCAVLSIISWVFFTWRKLRKEW